MRKPPWRPDVERGRLCTILSDIMTDQSHHRREVAEQHVAAARRAVEHQRKVVATFERRRLSSSDARSRLEQLERVLAKFEGELEAIMKELDK